MRSSRPVLGAGEGDLLPLTGLGEYARYALGPGDLERRGDSRRLDSGYLSERGYVSRPLLYLDSSCSALLYRLSDLDWGWGEDFDPSPCL